MDDQNDGDSFFLEELKNVGVLDQIKSYCSCIESQLQHQNAEKIEDVEMKEENSKEQSKNEKETYPLRIGDLVLYKKLPEVKKLPTKDEVFKLLSNCYNSLSNKKRTTYAENKGKEMPFLFGIPFSSPGNLKTKDKLPGFEQFTVADCQRKTMENFYRHFGQIRQLTYLNLADDGIKKQLKLHNDLETVKTKPNTNKLRSLLSDIYCSIFTTTKDDRYLFEREKNTHLPFLFHIPFKRVQQYGLDDIDDEAKGQYGITECMEISVIQAYEYFGIRHKLEYLENYKINKGDLPSGNELLASTDKFYVFSQIINKVNKIERRNRCTRNTRVGKYLDRPLHNKSYGVNYTIKEAIEIVYKIYTDLKIELPDDFVSKCLELSKNNIRTLMNWVNKLRMVCDECNNDDGTVSFIYSEEEDKIFNYKLCDECYESREDADHFQLAIERESKLTIDKSEDQLIHEAFEDLKKKSIEFLVETLGDLDKIRNTCKIYLVSEKDRAMNDINYSGFTSNLARIPSHVILTAVFKQLNISVTSGYYSKYTEWVNLLNKDVNLKIFTLFEESNVRQALFLENLSMKIRKNKNTFNIQDTSNILPIAFQPAAENLFYLIKGIHNNLKKAKALDVSLEVLKKINVDDIVQRYNNGETFREMNKFIHYNATKYWNYDNQKM